LTLGYNLILFEDKVNL